jgi:sugar phosphate isomerase/epimerase
VVLQGLRTRRSAPGFLHAAIAAAPGCGHLDFVPVMQALGKVGYAHYLSAEFLPPRYISESGSPPEFFDPYCAQTIARLKQAVEAAKVLS